MVGDGAGRVVSVAMPAQSSISMQRGAMLCMTPNVTLSVNYGFKKSYRRYFGGESVFHTTARVSDQRGGEIQLSVAMDANLHRLEHGTHLVIIPTHYVASSSGVKLELAGLKRMGLWARLLSNTNLFFMIAKGEGAIALESGGQLRKQQINNATKDDPFVVDNANVVAWTSHLKVKPRLAAQNVDKTQKKWSLLRRAMSSFGSEGVVLAFYGSGTVFYQTRVDRLGRVKKRMTRLERIKRVQAIANVVASQ